jgi:hypothetical protein
VFTGIADANHGFGDTCPEDEEVICFYEGAAYQTEDFDGFESVEYDVWVEEAPPPLTCSPLPFDARSVRNGTNSVLKLFKDRHCTIGEHVDEPMDGTVGAYTNVHRVRPAAGSYLVQYVHPCTPAGCRPAEPPENETAAIEGLTDLRQDPAGPTRSHSLPSQPAGTSGGEQPARTPAVPPHPAGGPAFSPAPPTKTQAVDERLADILPADPHVVAPLLPLLPRP